MKNESLPYIAGCYVAWSARLQAIYDGQFPCGNRVVVKIGRCHDILSRIENFRGETNRLSRKLGYAVDRDGKCHVKDWVLWLVKPIDSHADRVEQERILQMAHSPLAPWLWENWHVRLSGRSYAPKPDEIYIARESRLRDQFLDPQAAYDLLPAGYGHVISRQPARM